MTTVPATPQTPEWRLRDRLARSLDEVGLSVQQMADHLGVSRNTVGNYLSGRTVPNRSIRMVWAMRCGVPFEWIERGYDRDPNPPDTASDPGADAGSDSETDTRRERDGRLPYLELQRAS